MRYVWSAVIVVLTTAIFPRLQGDSLIEVKELAVFLVSIWAYFRCS